jgi:hypothetical protein
LVWVLPAAWMNQTTRGLGVIRIISVGTRGQQLFLQFQANTPGSFLRCARDRILIGVEGLAEKTLPQSCTESGALRGAVWLRWGNLTPARSNRRKMA